MPTYYEGTEEERLALDAYVKLMRASGTVFSRVFAAPGREPGLTETQFAVMEALLHRGPMTQTTLCGKILKSGSNLTTVLDNLERRGWVRRDRDPRDRRVQVVSLTDAGGDVIETEFPAHVRRVVDLMGALDAEEQRTLGRLCRKLGRAATEG